MIAGLAAGMAVAQELIVFPAKGQSNDQMEKDKYEFIDLSRDPLGIENLFEQNQNRKILLSSCFRT